MTAQVLKFLATGGIGISVNLGTYMFLLYLGTPYLWGSMLALMTSTIVGFVLQKYWTFAERSRKRAGLQFSLYAAMAAVNLGINTATVYILAGVIKFHPLISQAVGGAVIAVMSFIMYRYVIFTPSRNEEGQI